MRKSTLIDLTGQQFGRLKVLHRAPNRGKQTYWLCECQCENKTIKEVRGGDLKSGHTYSCGCWKREVDIDKISTYNTSIGAELHGKSYTRLYSIWLNMIKRCENSNHVRFADYGGRGIKVCKEWRDRFTSFETWAIHNGYDERLTIDRINNDGDYEPSNCRWTTVKVQNNNSRHNRLVEINGVVKTLKQWSEDLNIDYHLVNGRLQKGWTEHEALLIPIGERRLK